MFASPTVLSSPKLRGKSAMKHVQSTATMASSGDGSGSDASVDRVEIDGAMVTVHEDLKDIYSEEAALTRMMRLRATSSGTFDDCGDLAAEDLRPDGPVPRAVVENPVQMVEVDGVEVGVHEDLKELYGDAGVLARLMRLRLQPVPTFGDCGDIHSLHGWGTKGSSPTIRMQLESGSITLVDTLQMTGQPGAAA